MLEAGELDALFTARAPSCFDRKAPNVRRLFLNPRQTERDYYAKTGLFPIMHMIGVRKSLVAKYPWLPTSLYKAFCAAKDIAMKEVRDVSALYVTLPWLVAEAIETAEFMGDDFWRYGVNENLKEIDTLTRYAFEQGLVDRKVSADELFAKETYELSII